MDQGLSDYFGSCLNRPAVVIFFIFFFTVQWKYGCSYFCNLHPVTRSSSSDYTCRDMLPAYSCVMHTLAVHSLRYVRIITRHITVIYAQQYSIHVNRKQKPAPANKWIIILRLTGGTCSVYCVLWCINAAYPLEFGQARHNNSFYNFIFVAFLVLQLLLFYNL